MAKFTPEELKQAEELLREHYQYPEHKGEIENPDVRSEEYNPSCGDRVSITANIRDNKISEIKFTGTGCLISQATTSLLLELVLGKSVHQVKKMDQAVIVDLIKIPLGPTRLKCALLGLQVIQEALTSHHRL